ncbi:MAG: hypothetical protein KJ060_15630, partial [Candidatus Hydrogenedentes bacterium]|nr:hypothetical protein [Candidatus Hydrogenedentota bacterium]
DLLFVEQEYTRALTYYQRVLDTTPNHFAALLQAGLCAQRTGNAGAATSYFESAGDLRSDSWIPPYNLACLKAVGGDAEAALALLNEALDKAAADSALLQALQSDPDLAPLRDREDFKGLVLRAQNLPTS